MTTKNHTILLVDDDQDIIDLLTYNLQREGYHVISANNGEHAVEMTNLHHPSLILMDLMMPKMDGVEACENIRELNSLQQPMIAFLTSRSEDYSQIAGFNAGGDDYITKPIKPKVLLSKIEALLRRVDTHQKLENQSKSIVINREKYYAEIHGKRLTFPRKEFELLEVLVRKPGTVFTREQILAQVWGDETIVGERTVDVHIRKLREKVGNDYIRTIKGVGYTFKEH